MLFKHQPGQGISSPRGVSAVREACTALEKLPCGVESHFCLHSNTDAHSFFFAANTCRGPTLCQVQGTIPRGMANVAQPYSENQRGVSWHTGSVFPGNQACIVPRLL